MFGKIIKTSFVLFSLFSANVFADDDDRSLFEQGAGMAIDDGFNSITLSLKSLLEIDTSEEDVHATEFETEYVNWSEPTSVNTTKYDPFQGKDVTVNCVLNQGEFVVANDELVSTMNGSVVVEVLMCDTHTTMEYMNQTLLMPQNSIKFSIRMRNIMFQSSDNKMRIKFKVDYKEDIVQELEEELNLNLDFIEDENDEDGILRDATEKVIKEYEGKVDGLSKRMNLKKYYLDFPETAMRVVNGTTKEVKVHVLPSIKSGKVVIVTVPYFEELYYDPIIGDTAKLLLMAGNFPSVSNGYMTMPIISLYMMISLFYSLM